MCGRRSDLPHRLHPGVLYVVGNPTQWAIFACPCRAGHDVAIRVDDVGDWTLVRGGRRPTLSPSVNSFDAKRHCHFWLRDGRVHWCLDSDPVIAATRRGRSTAATLRPVGAEEDGASHWL